MNTKNTTINTRVNKELKDDVVHILSDLGLTLSDAINTLFVQIKLRKGLPYRIDKPNELTKQVMNDVDAGKNLHQAKDIDDLFDQLND